MQSVVKNRVAKESQQNVLSLLISFPLQKKKVEENIGVERRIVL